MIHRIEKLSALSVGAMGAMGVRPHPYLRHSLDPDPDRLHGYASVQQSPNFEVQK